MITRVLSVKAIVLPLFVVAGLTACTKENSVSTDDSTVTSSSTISVAPSARGTAAGDSIYVVCGNGQRNSITEAEVPASATAYLSANYSGYIFSKAFAQKDRSAGTVSGYVVVIFYNDKPVAVQFDASGNFVKVLEQRERGDIGNGPGWHAGGRFRFRDGLCHDTISLTSLSLTILTYMTTNYPTDTLVKAFVNAHDTSYAVISKNNGIFVTVFNSAGVFVRRVALPTPQGNCQPIEQNALPANVLSYLTSTYPNYVFEKAFAAYRSGAIQGYVVIINANNTKYGVRFDASGNFVSVRVIW